MTTLAPDAPDLYQVLGVHPSATVEQIKAAFRRQALKYHPDKNNGAPEAEERFKACNDACAVLSDAKRRADHDWARDAAKGMPEMARELLEELLGSRRRRRRAGRDLRYTLELPYAEAALGVRRPIRFAVAEGCGVCLGAGAAAGATRPCPTCGGKGETRERRGLLVLLRPCPRCGGQGIAILAPCEVCAGVGSVERMRDYLVTLHPGVRDGEVQVVQGEGEPGIGGGRAGDLHVAVRVRPHPLLREEGADLRLVVPLSLATAALGGTVEVPTLEGTVRLKIPPQTQSGRALRLVGKGLPRRGGARGDLLVTVEVETPVALDDEQRRLLSALAAGDARCHPRHEEFKKIVQELENVHT